MNSSDELRDANENPGGFSRHEEQKDDDRRVKRPLYSTRDGAEVRPYRPRKSNGESQPERPGRTTYHPKDDSRGPVRSSYTRPYNPSFDKEYDTSYDRPRYDDSGDRGFDRGFNRPLERQIPDHGNDRYGNDRGNTRQHGPNHGNERPRNPRNNDRPGSDRPYTDRSSNDRHSNDRYSNDRSRPRQPQDRGYSRPGEAPKGRSSQTRAPYAHRPDSDRTGYEGASTFRPDRGNERPGYAKGGPVKRNSTGPNRPQSGGQRSPYPSRPGSKPVGKQKPPFKGKGSNNAVPGSNYRLPRPEDAPFVPVEMEGELRLNKFIANAGVCSRREADKLIQAGAVTVNGKIVTTLGARVLPNDKVMFGDQTLSCERRYYVLLNKPKGFVTTMDDPQDRNTVMALTESACRERIFPVGRLDRNTTGLLLLTNDGELAKKLTHPSHRIRKVYQVQLDKPLAKSDMMTIAEGLELEDGVAEVDAIAYVGEGEDKRQIGIEIHTGRNRIVRRIFEKLKYQVVKLDRVAFAGLTKKSIPRGKWRYLSLQEINYLKML